LLRNPNSKLAQFQFFYISFTDFLYTRAYRA